MIWAQNQAGVIGADGTIPWSVPEDLARFKRLTMGHAVIMGRVTWESLPAAFRPLPGRANLVLSRTAEADGRHRTAEADGARVVGSVTDALDAAAATGLAEPVWVVGGGRVYHEFLPLASRAEVTVMDAPVEGDTAAPRLGPDWTLTAREPQAGWLTSRSGTRYRFETWVLQQSL
jgi:dihydrofolate reductase